MRKIVIFFITLIIIVAIVVIGIKTSQNSFVKEMSNINISSSYYVESNVVYADYEVKNNSKYKIAVYHKNDVTDKYTLLTTYSENDPAVPYFISSGSTETVGFGVRCSSSKQANETLKRLESAKQYVKIVTENNKEYELVI